ncbi:hypothetical protein DUNSADRAFT_16453 [Dunaliella salina]|uniref:Secreted protein n=1 Tax=Dunaliella salina TaxID=3046 RepID=A0ABQ7H0Z0_DUNSA|nr:hypothetical protein DUNSADRAFT_16453 [Dunaliella salina]|eukprot:KAF5840512.1 hypothetical protein DUNSADRAFT_16453 [Dunaliella salina]
MASGLRTRRADGACRPGTRCATIVYLVVVVVQWVNSPPVIASNAFWSIEPATYMSCHDPILPGSQQVWHPCEPSHYLDHATSHVHVMPRPHTTWTTTSATFM